MRNSLKRWLRDHKELLFLRLSNKCNLRKNSNNNNNKNLNNNNKNSNKNHSRKDNNNRIRRNLFSNSNKVNSNFRREASSSFREERRTLRIRISHSINERKEEINENQN